jgi:hypothetical protein
MTSLKLYTGNDQTVVLTGLTSSLSGSVITDATILGYLMQEGVCLTTLTFTASSTSGTYTAPILAANVPSVGTYKLILDGTATSGTFHLELQVQVLVRTF